jgi:ribosomal protein S18 acetylase RimI-like enzyme
MGSNARLGPDQSGHYERGFQVPSFSDEFLSSRRESAVIEYRPFRNSDLPQLVRLWHESGLGRGAAGGFNYEAFDRLLLGQHYFERDGLICACSGSQVVGFVHSGFGGDTTGSWIDRSTGAICAVVVHPSFRRHGIGRELLARGESYLRQQGAASIQVGAAPPCDSFYHGLYGGSEVSGFLESSVDAAPFLKALGYQPAQRYLVLQRNLKQGDPISFRLSLIRRKMDTFIFATPEAPTFWWYSRFGRLENVQFRLVPKGGGDAVAAVTVSGMDLYVGPWGERAIGLSELIVKDVSRRQGHAQTLLIEVIRRMRQEQVSLAEAHIVEENTAAIATFKSVGFQQIDCGVVYRRPR